MYCTNIYIIIYIHTVLYIYIILKYIKKNNKNTAIVIYSLVSIGLNNNNWCLEYINKYKSYLFAILIIIQYII